MLKIFSLTKQGRAINAHLSVICIYIFVSLYLCRYLFILYNDIPGCVYECISQGAEMSDVKKTRSKLRVKVDFFFFFNIMSLLKNGVFTLYITRKLNNSKI